MVVKTYGIPCPSLGCKHVMMLEELEPVASEGAIEQFHKFTQVHKENLERVRELRERLEREKAEAESKKPTCPRCLSMYRLIVLLY
jgi:hypothetical protein